MIKVLALFTSLILFTSFPLGRANQVPAATPELLLDQGKRLFEAFQYDQAVPLFDRLIAAAPGYLKKDGYLIVEIGSPQEAPARERVGRYADYELAKTIHDGSGHPRVLMARWRSGT